MKTREQILKWLSEQSWRYAFITNSFLCDSKHFIAYNENFMYSAFDWAETEEGTNFWSIRNTEYLKWYNSPTKPMSWEELSASDNSIQETQLQITSQTIKDKKIFTCGMSEDLCEAFIAYTKLIQLRNAWVQESNENHYRIYYNYLQCDFLWTYAHDGLSFPTIQMADEFIATFKDLLKLALPLI